MKLAEKEHKKYHKNKNSSTTQTKIKKEEKIPEWFNKEIKKQEATKEAQEEMKNLLKEYR